jgi:heat shock protein HtpX
MTAITTGLSLTTVPWGAVAVPLCAVILIFSALRLAGTSPRLAARTVCRTLRARPLGTFEAPMWHDVLRRLSVSRSTPAPALWVAPYAQVNLFALADGEGGARIVTTQGALESLGEGEVEAALGGALARARRRDLDRATLASAVGLTASALAGLGMVDGHEAEDHPFGWPLGVPILLAGGAAARTFGGPAPDGRADIEGALISGHALTSARLLEHMEFTAHVAPMKTSSAIARLALVDPLGEREPLAMGWVFPAPPPSATRAAQLRASAPWPESPERVRAA